MADNEQSNSPWTIVATDLRDVLIILAALAAITVLGVFIVQHYTSSKDATSVLGVLVPAVSTIAAAAFGVSAGVKAGAAAGTSAARIAEVEKQAVQSKTQDALDRLQDLRPKLEPVMNAAGTKSTLPPEQIATAKSEIASVERSLRSAL
jgi:hypothetical protein